MLATPSKIATSCCGNQLVIWCWMMLAVWMTNCGTWTGPGWQAGGFVWSCSFHIALVNKQHRQTGEKILNREKQFHFHFTLHEKIAVNWSDSNLIDLNFITPPCTGDGWVGTTTIQSTYSSSSCYHPISIDNLQACTTTATNRHSLITAKKTLKLPSLHLWLFTLCNR